jgi:hypothetical protein
MPSMSTHATSDRPCRTPASRRQPGQRLDALPWSGPIAQAANCDDWVGTVSYDGTPARRARLGVWDHTELRFVHVRPRSREADHVAANPPIPVAIDDNVECVSVGARRTAVAEAGSRPVPNQAALAESRRFARSLSP